MTTETLRCSVCGIPARAVKVGSSLILLGHTKTPKGTIHPVRLAPASRAGDGQTTASSLGTAVGSKGIRRQPGTPERVSSASDRARRRGGGAGRPSDPATPPTAPLSATE